VKPGNGLKFARFRELYGVWRGRFEVTCLPAYTIPQAIARRAVTSYQRGLRRVNELLNEPSSRRKLECAGMTSKGWFKVSAQALQDVPAEFSGLPDPRDLSQDSNPGRHSSEAAEILVVIPASWLKYWPSFPRYGSNTGRHSRDVVQIVAVIPALWFK